MVKRISCLLLCVMLLLTVTCAVAETSSGRGNLEERFSDIETIDFEGSTYYQKSRVTSMLFLGIYDDGTELGQLGFLMGVAADDNLKTATPIQFDCRTLIADDAGAEATLKEIYARSQTKPEACESVLAAINRLFPAILIDNYFGLDIGGLKVVDGKDFAIEESDEPQAKIKSRLKEMKAYADAVSTDEASDLMDVLSEYIYTNMKSGALMKIADKCDRYEVPSSLQLQRTCYYDGAALAEEELADSEIDPNDIRIVLDADALLEDVVRIFYDEIYW